MDLKERVAIVTGSAGGIGRSIALKFAALGARVVVADLVQAGDVACHPCTPEDGHRLTDVSP